MGGHCVRGDDGRQHHGGNVWRRGLHLSHHSRTKAQGIYSTVTVTSVSKIRIFLKGSADPYRHSEYKSPDLEKFEI
jgi:hypothetical protein